MKIPIITVQQVLNPELARLINRGELQENDLKEVHDTLKQEYINVLPLKKEISRRKKNMALLFGVYVVIGILSGFIAPMWFYDLQDIWNVSEETVFVRLMIPFGIMTIIVLICAFASYPVIKKYATAKRIYNQLISAVKRGYPSFFDTHEIVDEELFLASSSIANTHTE